MGLDRKILFRFATSEHLERAALATQRGERLAWRAAQRYVAGTTAREAFRVAEDLAARGVATSIDHFGEQVTDDLVAESVAADYLRLADELASKPEEVWLSIDLSHLGLDIHPQACAERLAEIARRMPAGRRIQVGAEDPGRADSVLECVLTVAAKGLAGRLGCTVQANLRRAGEDLAALVEAGVHVRLVKGAFVASAERAWPYGEPTDVAYLQLAHRLAESGVDFALATHDGLLREALLTALGPCEVEQLLGVRPAVLDELVARGVWPRVYVPFGENWFRYWMRRLAESRGV